MRKDINETRKKVPKITQEQYEEYIMSLKEEDPNPIFSPHTSGTEKGSCGKKRKN